MWTDFWAFLILPPPHVEKHSFFGNPLPPYSVHMVYRWPLFCMYFQNGLYNALPSLANLILSVILGYLSDWVLSKKYFSKPTTAKIWQTIGQCFLNSAQKIFQNHWIVNCLIFGKSIQILHWKSQKMNFLIKKTTG